ncbi:ankyrin repeat-containing protein BDA1-like [Gossypium arboreum]|uniref:ankyrin repeat-containing protein BDA1-like n=1 Tax=Gossypium arboreum TaxID=29729 RepID=UPI0008194FB4|nr:ankyrin repeat-containing protein BDA1-like [Gossypium arboreum]
MDEKMIDVAQTGDINILYELILNDPYVLQRIDDVPFFHTPLHVAASAGHIDFMMEMINLKPSFARKLNQAGFSPMHLALQNQKTQAVLRLLRFDEGLVRVKGREGFTPLHHVVQNGNVDFLIKILEVCPEAIEDVTVRDETVFHLAVKNDRFEAFQVLVGWLIRSRHKAANRWEKELLSWADIDGNTVLHVATIRNRPQVVKVLLGRLCGDHINAKNVEGLTALDIPSQYPLDEGKVDYKESIKDMISKAGGLSGSSSSLPKTSISSFHIESLKGKVSVLQKFATIASRGKKGIPYEMRNTFLVVTVLIITATYTATLNPPKQPDTISKNSPNFHLKYDASLGSTSTGPAPSPAPSKEEDLKNLLDVSTMFWLYNTLTFWAATVLTAYLLPSRSICLFILITLSLFGTCYMLLVAVSIRTLALQYLFSLSSPGSVSYPSLSITNYCLATVLALVTLYKTSYYMLYRFVPKRRFFLLLQVVSLCIFAVILVPAILNSEFILEITEYGM